MFKFACLLIFAVLSAAEIKFDNLGYTCPSCAYNSLKSLGMDDETARQLAFVYRSGGQATRHGPVSGPSTPAAPSGPARTGGYSGHRHGGGYGRGYGGLVPIYGGGVVAPIYSQPLV